MNSLTAKWPAVTRVLTNATAACRWTDDDEECLADLREEAERYRLFQPDEAPPPPLKVQARAVTATLLAMGNAIRLESGTDRPWPEEQPTTAELATAIAEAETALALLAAADGLDPGLAQIAGLMHVHCVLLLTHLAGVSAKTPDLLARIGTHADQIPRSLALLVPSVGAVKTMAKVYTREMAPSDPALIDAADQNRNLWDAVGGDYARAEAAANRADASGDPRDIRAAMAELEMVWIGLPTGSTVRGRTLTMLAEMQLALAASTNDLTLLADVIAMAIKAVRTIASPRVAQGASCILVDCLSMQTVIGHFQGPFAEASEEFRLALARLHPVQPAEQAALLAAQGAAIGLRAAALDDESLRLASRQLTEEAERLLPASAPSATRQQAEWLLHHRTAQSLLHWTAAQVLSGGDTKILPAALLVAEKLERYLADGAVTAAEAKDFRRIRKALLTAQRRMRHGKPPVPDRADRRARSSAERFEALRGQFPAPLADLRQALAAQLDDTRLRGTAHRVLGLRLAELYLADPAASTEEVLRDAITHISHALVAGEFTLPTKERAGLLELLARCYYESGCRGDDAWTRRKAELAARAALRELAGCALIAPDTGEALAVASRAGVIAARATAWCLADGRQRVAVDLAEAGRGLRLASVVIASRARELLRAAGEVTATDAWLRGTEADRAMALDALWDTPGGPRLLVTPASIEVSADMIGTRLDAVVYLVPPDAEAGPGPGQAVLVRPVTGEIEVVPLPGLTAAEGTPLAAYLTAFERAVAASVAASGGSDTGFRGRPEGAAWAAALDPLGRWVYDAIIGPLIAHARRWRLAGLPHLALIPLGELGAIPFAVAWTPATPTGARRYAIEDVVLSYAASARLLGEVSKRPRQRTDERVVFVADPTGEFLVSRNVLPDLARRLYPHATVYGLNEKASDGPATTAVVLDALPGRDRQGASLLHLTTHGVLEPEPAVQTRDGLLPLDRVLEQARDRAADAPGGLVITSACLTDVTRTGHDESLTLATAFLAAGATAVIGTRWPVDDDTTTMLAVRLHHHLKDGCPPAEALRLAQLELLRPDGAIGGSLGPRFAAIDDARLSHPASWAGHVHHGI